MALNFLNNGYFGGKLGVGDTTPLAKLEVAGSIKSTNYDTSHTSESGVTLGYNATEAMAYLETWTSKPLTIRTYNYQAFNISGIEAMRIDTNRNVGIGTTGPGANLDVAGTAPVIRITNTTDPLGNGTVGSFEFFTKDSSTGATRTVSSIVCDNNAGSSVPEGELVFKTSLGGGGSPIATEKMRINATGAIKFNAYNSTNQTGTPTYILGTDASGNVVKVLGGDIPGGGGTVTGTGTATQVAFWDTNTSLSGNSQLYWNNTSGFLGINDTSPGSRLKILSDVGDTNVYTVDIKHVRNDANISTHAMRINMDLSGADTTTSDRLNSALLIDIDSTANGDASNEHRIYGVNSQVNFTGFTDLARSGYFSAESNYTGAKTSQLVGVYGQAVHDVDNAAGGVSNMYGAYGYSSIQDTGDVDNAFGVYGLVSIGDNRVADVGVTKAVQGEITIDKSTAINYGEMMAVSGIIDNNEGAVPTFGNQYLFKGDYQGTKGGNAYGIYTEGDKHYFDGNIGIRASNPTSKLTVGENGITTKIATATIADTTAGASLTLRGGSPTIYFDRTGADPENKILMDSSGLEFKSGTLDAEGDVDFKIQPNGKLQAPAYAQGFLQSDANGNIDISGGGTLPGGPYLPLTAGSSYPLTGVLYAGQGVKFTGGTIAAATTVLHTNNVVYARGGSSGMFLQNADGSDGIFIANDHIRLETGSAERMRILSGGNVGIGTTTPVETFTVPGSKGAMLGFKRFYSNTGIVPAGIGPSYPLTITLNEEQGTTMASQYQYKVYNTTTGTGTYNSSVYIVYRNSSDNAWVAREVTRSGTTSNYPELTVSGDNIQLYNDHPSAYGVSYRVETTYTAQAKTSPDIFGSDYMWQRTSGVLSYTDSNVGIGTDNPTGYRLVVENTSEDLLKLHNSTDGLDSLISFTNPGGTLARIQGIDNGGLGFDVGNNAGGIISNAMFVKNNGNVGIGTTSPNDKLDVTDGNSKMVFGGASSDRPLLYFQHNAVPVDGEEIGLFDFRGYNSASQDTRYAIWTAKAEDVTDGTEDGSLTLQTMKAGTATTTFTGRSGKVGIANANPAQALDVTGKIRVTDDIILAQQNGRIDYDNGVSTGALRFFSTSGNTERMRITSAGNVGIGTTLNLGRELLVKGEIAALDNTGTNDNQILMAINNTIGNLAVTYGSTGSYVPFQLETSGTPRFTVSTAGAIKFNAYDSTNQTGTPTYLLGTDGSGNVVKTNTVPGSGAGPYLPLSAGSTVPLSGDLYLNDSKFVRFTTTGGSNGNASIDFSTGAAFSFVSNSSYAPMVFKTSSTERTRILANGNVGIGLTAPLHKLHVDGSTQLGRNGNNTAGDPQKTLISGQGIEDAATGNFYGSYGFLELNANNNYTGSARRIAITNGLLANRFAIIRSDTNMGPMQLGVGGAVPTGAVADFVIDTSGKVGIGTTDPVNNLNVNGDIGYIGVIGQGSIYGNTGNSSYANMQLYSPSTGYSTFNNQSYGYYFLTGGSTKMTILNNGNVGINSTSPPSLLDVQPTSANRKVTRIANDVMSTYFYNTQADAILAWTCGSYYQAEVVITANQTNGGTTANLYIRGIWSNNHTSHHWDELEHIGSLPGSTITMSVGQNGSTTNSGRLELDFDYINGSFAQLNVRVTDFYGSHSYTIT